MQNIETNLEKLFFKHFGHKNVTTEKLPESGSARNYYRLKSETHSAIGVFNTDFKENVAFIEFSKHFYSIGLNVPKIFEQDLEQNVYLQQDLGNETLNDRIKKLRKNRAEFPDELTELYFKIVEKLAIFQINAGKTLNYENAYPRQKFDNQSMQWDLNYFKYFFVKLADIPFNEQLLENDFQTLISFLNSTETEYFLFRDFQSRNIMLNNNEIYFIDYQGGRKGAIHYDLASLLYDSKADIPDEIRNKIKNHYVKFIEKNLNKKFPDFDEYYLSYALIRIMQATGAYGFRGFYQKKTYFIESIPFALKNIKSVLGKNIIPLNIPELTNVLLKITESEKLSVIAQNTKKLTVTVKSFSYKRGIPYDKNGNGGGFVFDCRFLENPGRIEKYKALSGKDPEIIKFLEDKGEIQEFLSQTQNIINKVIKKYTERRFQNLSIDFGCTGGQHRSVYCAEKTAEYIRNNFDINLVLIHTEGF